MWQQIIVGLLLIAALAYLGKRIYRTLIKGHDGACADCPPGELKHTVRK